MAWARLPVFEWFQPRLAVGCQQGWAPDPRDGEAREVDRVVAVAVAVVAVAVAVVAVAVAVGAVVGVERRLPDNP